MSPYHYKQYEIRQVVKPIPDRNHDFEWQHRDYDGPGDNRCGTAKSLNAACDQIDENIAENE